MYKIYFLKSLLVPYNIYEKNAIFTDTIGCNFFLCTARDVYSSVYVFVFSRRAMTAWRCGASSCVSLSSSSVGGDLSQLGGRSAGRWLTRRMTQPADQWGRVAADGRLLQCQGDRSETNSARQ